MKTIIAGGGTGGHLFPGVAVAREILRRDPAAEVLFVGTRRGLEARLVPEEGFPLRCLPAGSMKGIGWTERARNAWATVKGIVEARRILREFRPAVVIGVGGYASFPMLMAAILGGYPRLILEQNALPGLTNRVLARWVDAAALTDPKTASFFGARAVVTGNPVRPQFKSIAAREHRPPYQVLVFGGSQGAQAINKAVRECLPLLGEFSKDVRFVHQAGAAQVEETRAAYAAAGISADVRPFFNNFHEQYAAADLIVSRAGATTIAELRAAGRAAILIPLPTAADDHQTRNAESVVADEAGLTIPNAQLSGARLAATIRDVLSDIPRLERMERNARQHAALDAEKTIVDLAERVARGRRHA